MRRRQRVVCSLQAVEWALFLVLAWYLEQVLPSGPCHCRLAQLHVAADTVCDRQRESLKLPQAQSQPQSLVRRPKAWLTTAGVPAFHPARSLFLGNTCRHWGEEASSFLPEGQEAAGQEAQQHLGRGPPAAASHRACRRERGGERRSAPPSMYRQWPPRRPVLGQHDHRTVCVLVKCRYRFQPLHMYSA